MVQVSCIQLGIQFFSQPQAEHANSSQYSSIPRKCDMMQHSTGIWANKLTEMHGICVQTHDKYWTINLKNTALVVWDYKHSLHSDALIFHVCRTDCYYKCSTWEEN